MKVLSYLDCGCAVMEDGSRSVCPSCSAPQPVRMANVVHSESSDELIRLKRTVRAIQHALGTEETGLALIQVASDAHRAEMELARNGNDELQATRDALAALLYTAERCAELIVSVSDRYDLDVAVESAKDFLAGLAAGAGGWGENAPPKEATDNAGDERATPRQ